MHTLPCKLISVNHQKNIITFAKILALTFYMGSIITITEKSRRDETLLTVVLNLIQDNLRNIRGIQRSQSLAGTAIHYKFRPCGTLVTYKDFSARRLKSTVN